MKKYSSLVILSFVTILLSASLIIAANPSITLTPLSPTTICATGNDTLLYSVNAANIPTNTDVVIYQSTDSTFNPSLGQGDSIGFVLGSSIPRDTVNFGNCVKTLGIFIDACGVSGTEPRNEYIIMTSGNGIKVSNLAIDFDPANNSSGDNNDNDINTGTNPCGYKLPTPSLISALQVGSCNPSNVIAASPTDSIPANAIIVCFTSDSVTVDYNINGLCNLGYPIYVVQSACIRTQGAFTNSNNCSSTLTTRYKKTIVRDKRLNCQDNFVYDRCGIFNLDGTYAIRQQGTDTARVSNNGIRRNAVDSCGGIDYTQLNFSTDTTLKFAIPTAYCNTGVHYIKAVLKPQTQPETVSNTIPFEYICNDVTATSNTTNICSGQNALINISSTNPNATFSWTVSGGANITGASAGSGNQINQTLTYSGTTNSTVTYNIVSNDAGCVKRTSVNVVVRNCDSCNLTTSISGNLSFCQGSTTTLSTLGQYDSIRWNTGATTSSISVNQAGTYSVIVYQNECSASASAIVTQQNVNIIITGDTAICNNSTTTLFAEGQFDSVRWNTGATTNSISVNQIGTYSVTGYLNGCSSTASTTVSANSINVSIAGNTSTCNSASTTISAVGQFDSIRWNTGETTASITTNQIGNYTVTAYKNGCSGTATTNITQTILEPTITGGNAICGGTSVTLSTQTTYDSVRWNTNATSTSIDVASSGLYSVTAYKNGCSATATFNVFEISLTFFVDHVLDTICTGDTAQFIIYGGDVLLTPFDTVYFTQPGRYLVSYTTPMCGTYEDSVVVIERVIQQPTITGNLSFCTNQSTTLQVTEQYDSYVWQPNGETTNSITANQAGIYSVTVKSENCSATSTVQVSTVPLLQAFNLGADTSFCGNFSKVLSTGNTNTVWSTGDTASQITVTQAGQYIATISNLCETKSDTIIIIQHALPSVFIGNDTAFCDGQITLAVNSQDVRNILWSTGAQTDTISISSIGTYSVIVTNTNGCSNSDAINITSDCANEIWLPNAFTPDGNGNNDVFYVRGNPQNTVIEKFVIYNRWGNKVFEANNILPDDKTKGWNGTYKDKIEQLEVYGYMVIAKFANGEKRTLKGNVTLLK